MKTRALISILLILIALSLRAQPVPVFEGTTYENGGAMGDDQTDTWSYKGFVFVTITPGISRPTITTKIYAQNGEERSLIRNNELFGRNVSVITEMVNSKLQSEFIAQKREDPICFKEYYPIGINELSISIDKMYMYFEMIWESAYLSDSDSECMYVTTVVKFNLSEVSHLVKTL
jgi:hypothetical protein